MDKEKEYELILSPDTKKKVLRLVSRLLGKDYVIPVSIIVVVKAPLTEGYSYGSDGITSK